MLHHPRLWSHLHYNNIPIFIHTLSSVSPPAPPSFAKPIPGSACPLLSSFSSSTHIHLHITSTPLRPHLHPVFDSFPSTPSYPRLHPVFDSFPSTSPSVLGYILSQLIHSQIQILVSFLSQFTAILIRATSSICGKVGKGQVSEELVTFFPSEKQRSVAHPVCFLRHTHQWQS